MAESILPDPPLGYGRCGSCGGTGEGLFGACSICHGERFLKTAAPPVISQAICSYCEESIAEGEQAPTKGNLFHRVCLLRIVVGSLAHLQNRCPCHGGTEGDPPDMTRRQAAQAAVDYWYTTPEGAAAKRGDTLAAQEGAAP